MHCRPDAFAHAFPDARCQPSIVVSPSRLDLRVARRLASFPAWRRFFFGERAMRSQVTKVIQVMQLMWARRALA